MNAVTLASLLAIQWAEPPNLALGDRVRVHVLEQATVPSMPVPRVNLVMFDGTLTFYAAGDRLTLQRDKATRTSPIPPALEFNWIELHRIDVPRGSKWLTGAAKGAGVALIAAGGHAFFCSAFGGEPAEVEGCYFWKYVGFYALVTVPVGTFIGSRSTRWKPVYQRNR